MTETIRKQVLAVRATGETNMLDTRRVQVIANRMGFYELVVYLEEHRKEYANFILTGSTGGGKVMNTLDYNVSGEKRKRLVRAMSEILGEDAVYQGAPSFAYQVDDYTVSRNGLVTCPDTATREEIIQVGWDTAGSRGLSLRTSRTIPLSLQ